MCWRKTTPWHPSLPWKTAFTGRAARGSWFRPLVETSLLKAALGTALIPLGRQNRSQPEAAPDYFLLQCMFFYCISLWFYTSASSPATTPPHQTWALQVREMGVVLQPPGTFRRSPPRAFAGCLHNWRSLKTLLSCFTPRTCPESR